MGDEFYAIIKLVSGEEVLSLVSVDENDGDPLIVIQQSDYNESITVM